MPWCGNVNLEPLYGDVMWTSVSWCGYEPWTTVVWRFEPPCRDVVLWTLSHCAVMWYCEPWTSVPWCGVANLESLSRDVMWTVNQYAVMWYCELWTAVSWCGAVNREPLCLYVVLWTLKHCHVELRTTVLWCGSNTASWLTIGSHELQCPDIPYGLTNHRAVKCHGEPCARLST